jgi:dienelactone hydrolase
MKLILASLVCIGLFPTPALSQIKFVPSRFGLDIEGSPAGFNSKSPHVFVSRPRGKERSPVLLYIHGGAGFGPVDKAVTEFFRSLGFGTVAFDAFKLNQIALMSTRVTLSAKQKMLVPVSEQTLAWVATQDWATPGSIYIYGHSNGATVALWLAGRVDPTQVRAIFAEGPAQCCLSLPEQLNVPVKLLFGDQDNWGGDRNQDLLFKRINPLTGTSTKNWADRKASDSKFEVKIYKGGHGLFGGMGQSSIKARGAQWRRGGDDKAVKADIKQWIGMK